MTRWRLILGKDAQEDMARMSPAGCALSAEQLEMDEALEAIYASDRTRKSAATSGNRRRKAGRTVR